MKRIEAIMKRVDLSSFYHCAEKLGIFGFDLSENRNSTRRRIPQPAPSQSKIASELPPRLKVEFAVMDTEAKDTVHAMLQHIHPDSIAIFKLDQEQNR